MSRHKLTFSGELLLAVNNLNIYYLILSDKSLRDSGKCLWTILSGLLFMIFDLLKNKYLVVGGYFLVIIFNKII